MATTFRIGESNTTHGLNMDLDGDTDVTAAYEFINATERSYADNSEISICSDELKTVFNLQGNLIAVLRGYRVRSIIQSLGNPTRKFNHAPFGR
jgi:hypothetical protein